MEKFHAHRKHGWAKSYEDLMDESNRFDSNPTVENKPKGFGLFHTNEPSLVRFVLT